MLINNGYANQLITLKNIKDAVGSSISDSNQVVTHNITDTTAAMQSDNYIAVFNTKRPKTSDYTNRTVRNEELNVISKNIDVPDDPYLHEICIGYTLRYMQSYNIVPSPAQSGTFGTYAPGSGYYNFTFNFGNSFDGSCRVQDNVQWANSSGSGTKTRTEDNSSLDDSYDYWGYKYYPPYFEYPKHSGGIDYYSYATFTIDLCGLLNKEIEMYVVFAAPSSITYTDQSTWSHTTNNTDLRDLKINAIYNALQSNLSSNGYSLQTGLLMGIFSSTLFNSRFTSVLTRTLTFDEYYTLYSSGWYKNVNISGINSVTHKYYIRKLKFVPRLYWCNGSPFYEAMTLLRQSARSEYLEDSYQNSYRLPVWDMNDSSYNTIVDGTMDTSLIYNNYGAEYVGQGIYTLGDAEGKIFAGLRDNRTLYSVGVSNYLDLMFGNPGFLRIDYGDSNWHQSDDTYDTDSSDLANFITNIDDYNYFTYYVGVDVGTNGIGPLNRYMSNNRKYLWRFEYEDFTSRYSVSNTNLRIRKGNAYMNSITALGRYVWMMPVFTCYYKETNNNIYYDYPTYPQNQTYYGLLSKKTIYNQIYPVTGLIKDNVPHFYNIDSISGGYGYGYGGVSNYTKLHISC